MTKAFLVYKTAQHYDELSDNIAVCLNCNDADKLISNLNELQVYRNSFIDKMNKEFSPRPKIKDLLDAWCASAYNWIAENYNLPNHLTFVSKFNLIKGEGLYPKFDKTDHEYDVEEIDLIHILA